MAQARRALRSRWNRGQSFGEYAILIAVIVGSFAAMMKYGGRAMNAFQKKTLDKFTTDQGALAQYHPYYEGDSKSIVSQGSSYTEGMTTAGNFTKTGQTSSMTQHSGGYTATGGVSQLSEDDSWK